MALSPNEILSATRTVNEEVLDQALRHAHHLQRLTTHEVNEIVGFLNRDVLPDTLKNLRDRLENISQRGFDTGPWTTSRVRNMLGSTNEIMQKGMQRAGNTLRADLQQFTRTEAQWQARSLSQATGALDIAFQQPSVSQLNSILTSRPYQGRVFTKWWNNVSRSSQNIINQQVGIGLAEGETVDQMIRRLKGTLGARFRDGALERVRHNVEATVRTATNHINVQAREMTYEENDEVIKGIQYVATLDGRTTAICQSLDGKVFDVGDGPRPPQHYQCRSTTVPVLKSLKELGLPALRRALPPGTRATAEVQRHLNRVMNGQVPAKVTYGQWLKRQTTAVQNDILGPARGKLFRSGRVSIERFVDARNRPLTLAQLEARGYTTVPSKMLMEYESPVFPAFTESQLAGKTVKDMKILAKNREIKYFGVMQKKELREALMYPDRVEKISKIAAARWQHKTIVPHPGVAIKTAATGYKSMKAVELKALLKSKGIKNFQVMTKDQMITVLSDPAKHDQIQIAVRAKLRTARGAKPMPSREPISTRPIGDVNSPEWRRWKQGLSREESSALHRWTGSEFRNIRAVQGAPGGGVATREAKWDLKSLEKLYARSPRAPGKVWCGIDGLSAKDFKRMAVEDTVTFHGFASTSKARSIAVGFGRPEYGKSIVYRITHQESGMALGGFEKEVLMRKGSTFRVTSRMRLPGGQLQITMEEITPLGRRKPVLLDVILQKKRLVNEVVDRGHVYGKKVSPLKFEKSVKKWLGQFDMDDIQRAKDLGLDIQKYDSGGMIGWRRGTGAINGIYSHKLRKLALVKMSQKTFNHEFGHFIHHNLAAKGIPYNAQRDVGRLLERARERVLNQMRRRGMTGGQYAFRGRRPDWMSYWKKAYHITNPDTMRAYSLKSEGEFFADGVASYMTKGNHLLEKEPRLYALIKEHIFHGKEFP